MIGLKRGTVELVTHDPSWMDEFLKEKETIISAVNESILRIDHVGSTAIPGIKAKPLIDIAMEVESEAAIESIATRLFSLGYTYFGDREGKGDHFLAKGPDSERTHYLHVSTKDSSRYDEAVYFRDRLRADRQLAREYEKVKESLILEFRERRSEYTKRKGSFIENVMKDFSKQSVQTTSASHRVLPWRLILRDWKDTDFDPFAEMNSDPEVMRYLAPVTRSESLETFDRIREEISQRGWGVWAVEVDGVFAGMVGLHVPEYKLPFSACTEVLWRLRKEFWGRGIAHTAAQEAIDYGFSKAKLEEIVSCTTPKNVRSIRLMERLGFKRDHQGDFDHPALPVDSHLRRHVLYRKKNPKHPSMISGNHQATHIDVRRAQASDAEAIECLYRELVSDRLVRVLPEEIARLTESSSSFLLVGLSSGDVCATALLTLCPDVMYQRQPFGLVENLIVSEQHRRSGLGRQLMAHIEGIARENNCTKLMLLSGSHRHDAHSFFNSMGFEVGKKTGFVKYGFTLRTSASQNK